VLTVMAFLTPALLIALCIQLAWTRIVVTRATEAKERDAAEASMRHKVDTASAELLTAIGTLHDDIKAERIARSAAEVAARSAARGASVEPVDDRRTLTAPPPAAAPAAVGGESVEPVDDRRTPTVPPSNCAEDISDDETIVIDRECMAAQIQEADTVGRRSPGVVAAQRTASSRNG
jgi:hypothetical protein